MQCNQICRWNDTSDGCIKPAYAICPMSNMASQEKPQTNADCIRAMSDEELADLLTSANKGAITDICRKMHYEYNLEWLKQPTKENDDERN